MASPDPLLGADGPVVIVTGAVARRLAGPLVDLLRQARNNGEHLDDDLVATVRAFDVAGRAYAESRVTASLMSANGPADMPEADIGGRSEGHAEITVAEAANRLGVTPRHARRLAAEGRFGGRRIGSAHLVDAVLVGEYARGK